MKKRAEIFPKCGPALSMILYVYRFLFHSASGLRTQLDGREMLKKINQRHPRQGKERIKHFCSTFSLLCPLLSLLALQQVGARDEQSVPLQIRWGLQSLLGSFSDKILLNLLTWIDCTGVLCYQTNNWLRNQHQKFALSSWESNIIKMQCHAPTSRRDHDLGYPL